MKRRLFAKAIALNEERLAAVPTDLSTVVMLGICHLLNQKAQI